jgi:hypothetical protein
VARAGEVLRGQAGRQVEQHARDGRDRDLVERRDVEDVQLPDAVDDDARAPALRCRRNRHLRPRRGAAKEPQQVRGRAVAHDSAGAARQGSRHVARAHRRRLMPDRIDTAVHPPQPAVRQPALDALAIHARRDQLRSGDASMLAAGDSRGRVE